MKGVVFSLSPTHTPYPFPNRFKRNMEREKLIEKYGEPDPEQLTNKQVLLLRKDSKGMPNVTAAVWPPPPPHTHFDELIILFIMFNMDLKIIMPKYLNIISKFSRN